MLGVAYEMFVVEGGFVAWPFGRSPEMEIDLEN